MHTIVSDMDGTLLTADHRLSERSLGAIRAAQDRGIRVILASGRCEASMRPYVRQIGGKDPYIACNGAQILAPDGQALYERLLEPDVLRALILWLRERRVYAQVYYGDDFYYERECGYAEDYRRSSGIRGNRVADLAAFAKAPSVKVLGIADPKEIPALLDEARATFGAQVYAATSNPEFLELTHPEVSKGNAVAALGRRLGFGPEGCLCAGDSINDMSMIAWAGMGVAVANAREEVKAIAWRIAGHGQEDGLAALIEQLLAEGYGP